MRSLYNDLKFASTLLILSKLIEMKDNLYSSLINLCQCSRNCVRLMHLSLTLFYSIALLGYPLLVPAKSISPPVSVDTSLFKILILCLQIRLNGGRYLL